MIVPEDMYRGLLAGSSGNTSALEAGGQQIINADEAKGLSLSNNLLSTTLKKEKNLKNAQKSGTKNALYNQELRRYLRLRKQAMDRPIKVAVTKNTAIPTTTQNVGTYTKANRPIIVPRKRRGRPSLHFISPDDDVDRDAEMVSGGIHEEGVDDWFEQQQPENAQPTTSRQTARRKRREAKGPQTLSRAINAFKGHIMDNRAAFGVSPNGNVKYLSSNKMIPGANLDDIAERLINPTMKNMPSPPGTNIIANKAIKDPFLRTLMFDRFYTNETFNTQDYFTPKGRKFKTDPYYSSSQSGHGLNKNKFFPSKWKL